MFFIDKCLPFGASISCALFQRFSNALCYLIEKRTSSEGQITNYLDNFLFLALSILLCNRKIQAFLDLCSKLSIPVSAEKTEWAAERVIFLGILLDGRHYVLSIPCEKCEHAIKLLSNFLDKKKTTVKELQILCGYLNFLGKAVFPGRTLH